MVAWDWAALRTSCLREAVRVLTTMMTAVFDGWRQPIDVALGWIDDVRREWTAVYRFFGAAAPRS